MGFYEKFGIVKHCLKLDEMYCGSGNTWNSTKLVVEIVLSRGVTGKGRHAQGMSDQFELF